MALLTWAVLLLAGLTYTHAYGTPTPIGDLRSVAQIEFNLVSSWRQQCVGSILTNYHVLTTARCMQTTSNNRRVRVGTDSKAYGGIIRELAIIVIHPYFSTGSDDADIAIARAGTSWILGGPAINSIAIVPQGYYLPAYYPLSVAGWGVTAQGGLVSNGNLHTVALENKPMQGCVHQFGDRITPNMVCLGLVGRNGRDFDPSDMGAPVLYSVSGVNYLYGVVSFGNSASNNEAPIVAQAIGAYSYWILDNAI